MENKHILTANGELYHWGVKGMKWGVRRYQNADGSLTERGRKRYARDAQEQNWKIGDDGVARGKHKKGAGEVHEPDADRWVKEDLGRTKKLVDESTNLARNAQNLTDSVSKTSKKTRMDLSEMSDQELRNQINRAMLERQYNDMFSPPTKAEKGRAYLSKTVNIGVGALAVTSSALGIALAIKELKG